MGNLCCTQKSGKVYKKTMLTYKELKATYEIDKNVLGKGSFGTVYKASNKKNKKQLMAIKAIDKRQLSKKEIEDIHIEVQTIQSVDHSNIVNYYETYEDTNLIYLCMELCTGSELIENCMSQRAEFNEKKASQIIYSLLSALNHMHSMGLIHRDIKPENIMFDKPNGIVKFIDFGLAC